MIFLVDAFRSVACMDMVTYLILISALTEKIVAVLPRMKCPHRIEPHQIQGLDFIHIYPVIQVRGVAIGCVCEGWKT